MKPRIFLGSSGQQEKLLQALTRGLQDIADVDAWTTADGCVAGLPGSTGMIPVSWAMSG